MAFLRVSRPGSLNFHAAIPGPGRRPIPAKLGGPGNLSNGGAMTVRQLIAELQKFPPDTEVNVYAVKCCNVQPIHRVHFQPSDSDISSFVLLVDETVEDSVPD